VARARGVASAKAYRGEITARMAGHGRSPSECKVMFCTSVVLGETMQEAFDRKQRIDAALAENFEPRLAQLSFLSGIDFSRFDLDAPLPDSHTNASRSLTMLYTYGTGPAPCAKPSATPAVVGSISSAPLTAWPRKWARPSRRSVAMAS